MEHPSIIKLDEITHTLAQMHGVDEVKAIIDKAEALRVYARQAGLGLEAQNHAAEIKLRAERRAGELLREVEREQGSRTDITSLPPVTKLQEALDAAGTSNKTAHQWQQIAAIPAERFEAALAQNKADGHELTSSGMARLAANYKLNNKTNHAAHEYIPQKYDDCQTPAHAIDPLLPYLQSTWTVWEPACGEGILVEALYDSFFSSVVATDILAGQNFFDYTPPQWDCLITNPPFSLKYRWLERCYQLEKPFALLLPVETLGAKTAQDLFRAHGVEIVLMDRRINFKMPQKGWEAAGAPFPVAWFTWGLNLGQQLVFSQLPK